jgi:2-alkyl-3-oxoalkanoate reductase
MSNKVFQVGFIGTGNIAGVHADAIKALPNTKLAAVYDPNAAAQQRFAGKYGAKPMSLEEMLASREIDALHVLTPPDSHATLVNQFQTSGKSILVEKPIATTTADIQLLKAMGQVPNQFIGVNQNMVFHPAMQELRAHINSGKYGKIKQLDLTFRPALRQLSAMQFSHWMFGSNLNLLLEQAVHPVSQILALLGKPDDVQATAGERLTMNSDLSVVTTFTSALRFGSITASLNFGVGALYPVWKLTAFCDDGVIEADMVSNICVVQSRTPYIDPLDNAISLRKSSKAKAGLATSNLIQYSKSTAGIGGRSDSFYLGIKNSVEHFYGAMAGKHELITNVKFGLDAVDVCYELNDKLQATANTKVATSPSISASTNNASKGLVCLLGASGFIGRYTVDALIKEGWQVRAVARTVRNLPDVFAHPQVELMRGDVKKAEDLEKAMKGADYVVNLAHGGGGANYAEIKTALVDSAVLVAKKAAEAKAKRVIHIGSIAGLYLGDANERITGSTPSDPQPEVRGDYARAKALADDEFAACCVASGIDFVILRPGVVVGKGTHPLHAGLGFFNNEGHVVGWSEGEHNIPFVLVADVASAIVKCMTSPAVSKKSYNISGDVHFSVKNYIDELNKAQGRSVVFHPKKPRRLWVEDVFKNVIKRVGGRSAPFPNIRDFRSRAMFAQLDCSDLKTDANWTPESDREKFIRDIFA